MLNLLKAIKITGIDKLREAQSIWTEIDNKRGIAFSYIGLGFIFTITNEKQNALENYQKAEQMFPEGVDLIEKAKLYGGLAAINYHYKKFDISEQYFREALTLYEKVDYEFGQLSMFLGLASIYYQNDNKAASNDLYKKALSLGTKLNNKFILAQINEYLSLIDIDDGKYDEAISKLKKSQKAYRQLGIALPVIENRLGKAFEKKGEFAIAKNYYISALKVNRRIKDTVEIAENLYDLARLSKFEGNIEKALEESNESLFVSEMVYNDVGNDGLRSSYLSDVFERYELHINLLMKMHERFPENGFDEKALRASEKSRSRLMLERLKLSEADFTRDADPALVEKEKRTS